MFPAMFKILQWHQFLVTSALIAFLELFCDSGCSVKNSTKVTMFYLMFGGAYVVGLDCQCVWQFVQLCSSWYNCLFKKKKNEEPEFWLLLYKFKTQVEVMLYGTSDKEGITSAWQLMEDYLHQLLYGHILMYLCFSWKQKFPSHIGKGESIDLLSLLQAGPSCREVKFR